MTDAKPKKGTKITPDELKSIDPAKIIKAEKLPDVEGQELYDTVVACPWCDTWLRVTLSTDVYLAITCPNCGQHFRR